MPEEIKEIKETKNEECFCKNIYFRNFLTTTAGVFVGGFLALSLFSAINKPPMSIFPMHPSYFYHTMPAPIIKYHYFPFDNKIKYSHKFEKRDFNKQMFTSQKENKKQEKNND